MIRKPFCETNAVHESRTSEKPLIIYYHIPKTAGNSLKVALSAALGQERVHWYLGNNALLGDAEDLKKNENNLDVIGGHFSYRTVHQIDFKRKLLHVSMLRHPLELIISAYEFVRHRSDHRNYTNTRPDQTTFIDTNLFKRMRIVQCSTLGRRRSFRSASKNIQRNRFIVGTVDDPQKVFDNMIVSLGHRLTSSRVGHENKGDDKYQDILDMDKVKHLLGPYIQDDQRLFNFITHKHSGLFNST